ncbi:hypothetical protein PTKIN_Ptkin09bG0220200 [Pterospermum kingtungense]
MAFEERIVEKIEDTSLKGKQVVVTEASPVKALSVQKGECSGSVKSGSVNRFASLVEEDSVEDSKLNEEHSAGKDSQVDVKKIRASSLEVVGVVRACKPRKKGTGDKAKKSGGSVMVKEIATMDQCVTVVVEDNLEVYFFSVVYGSNDGFDHRRLRLHLK